MRVNKYSTGEELQQAVIACPDYEPRPGERSCRHFVYGTGCLMMGVEPMPSNGDMTSTPSRYCEWKKENMLLILLDAHGANVVADIWRPRQPASQGSTRLNMFGLPEPVPQDGQDDVKRGASSTEYTCPRYDPAPGSRRCRHYLKGGPCALPSEFMCIEWLKANGHPLPADPDLKPGGSSGQQAPSGTSGETIEKNRGGAEKSTLRMSHSGSRTALLP